jgi:hypothetical protein
VEATEEIRVEYVSMHDISKWPRNPKDHDHKEIQKSFYRFGFIKPVLVDEGTGQLVAGHGRLDTLKILKDHSKQPPRGVQVVDDDTWLIPVLRGVTVENPAEAEAFLLADNRLSEIGGWNQDLLAEMLGEIVDVDGALEGIGFNVPDVMTMVADHELDLDSDVEASKQKGYRQYTAILTPSEYRFIIDTLVHIEKELLTEEEYNIINRKGYCLYKVVKEWSEVREGS